MNFVSSILQCVYSKLILTGTEKQLSEVVVHSKFTWEYQQADECVSNLACYPKEVQSP